MFFERNTRAKFTDYSTASLKESQFSGCLGLVDDLSNVCKFLKALFVRMFVGGSGYRRILENMGWKNYF